MATLVEFRHLTYRIGGREILHDINLTVQGGETLVLLGRSGSGKTTLLKTVNRLIEPSEGEIRLEGRPVGDWRPEQLRRRIGYVIQEGGLFPHWTVERNVALVPTLEQWPDERRRARTAEVLNAVGLAPSTYGPRFPRQLSGGEKQRVGIARALAAGPFLMLLDEPFAALDPVTRYELQRHFLALRQSMGTTAVFVTHDVREALMMASRIALLRNGKLEMVATPDQFLQARSDEAQAFLATLAEDWRTHESRARQ
jgi:osmoprotectant transport system ATP-binding protein